MNLESLLRENFILKSVLNCVDVAVQIIDCQGITRLYNKVAAEMDGVEPEEVLGKHVLEVYPSLTAETSTLLKVLKTGTPILNKQQTVINHRGKAITMLFSTYPLFYNQEIIGACDISRDITKIKELSERLVDLQVELLGKRNGWRFKGDQQQKAIFAARYTFNDFVGQDPQVIRLKALAQRVAQSDSPIFVYGETGTGKELLVQAIHHASPFCGGPFIGQNCAALPATLLESILFGTVKGSFTGAEDRQGLFEMAHGGTLLFDEINSMPLELQGKLLRVLQEGALRRVGDSRLRRVNVRIIATTNMEPMEAVKQKLLRSDLFYRLNVVSLQIPPLRERPGDILPLTQHFITMYNRKFGLKVSGIDDQVRKIFLSYPWPGNVRELQHCIEHAMNIVDGPVITEQFLPAHILQAYPLSRPLPPDDGLHPAKGLADALREVEKGAIEEALEHCSWNVSCAARRLRIPRQTLQYKLKCYNLSHLKRNRA